MAKLGKQIENRLTVSNKVAASAHTHGGDIARALAEHAEAVEGPKTEATPEAFEAILEALGHMLEHASDELKKTELAYAAEQADDVKPRNERDALTAEITTLMTRLKSTVEDALGPEALTTYGLEGATPRAPRPLVNHVANVVSLLEKKPAKVTTDLGSTFSTDATVAKIKPKGAALEAVLKTLDREARELEQALGARDQAVDLWTETYQGVASALSGLYRLAGRKDLADRVRPTSRTISGEDAATTSGDTGAGGPAPGEA